jgi:hypothetical protein
MAAELLGLVALFGMAVLVAMQLDDDLAAVLYVFMIVVLAVKTCVFIGISIVRTFEYWMNGTPTSKMWVNLSWSIVVMDVIVLGWIMLLTTGGLLWIDPTAIL